MIEIKMTLFPLETLHIGTGLHGVGLVRVQSTIKTRPPKLDKRLPFIPGSSIKGAVRLNYSRLFELYREIYPNSSVQSENDLFGKADQQSLIFFSDALPKADLDPETIIQSRVKITDKSRVAEKGGLFHYEKICPQTHFEGRILMKNSNPDTFRLILMCLRELKYSGIGHNRSSIAIKDVLCSEKSLMPIVIEVFEEKS